MTFSLRERLPEIGVVARFLNNEFFAILSFTSVFIVRSGAVWRQDLAICLQKAPATARSNKVQ